MTDFKRCPWYVDGICDPKGWNLICLNNLLPADLFGEIPPKNFEECGRYKIFRAFTKVTDELRLAAQKLRIPKLF
jgi:hypothetical protein